jgi:hypothetical protein
MRSDAHPASVPFAVEPCVERRSPEQQQSASPNRRKPLSPNQSPQPLGRVPLIGVQPQVADCLVCCEQFVEQLKVGH